MLGSSVSEQSALLSSLSANSLFRKTSASLDTSGNISLRTALKRLYALALRRRKMFLQYRCTISRRFVCFKRACLEITWEICFLTNIMCVTVSSSSAWSIMYNANRLSKDRFLRVSLELVKRHAANMSQSPMARLCSEMVKSSSCDDVLQKVKIQWMFKLLPFVAYPEERSSRYVSSSSLLLKLSDCKKHWINLFNTCFF